MNPWRVFLLNLFGAKVSKEAAIAASARIWLPAHLELGPRSTLGPGVDCYNMAPIAVGARTIVSQRAFLCAGAHDIRDPSFQLTARPIFIGDDVWIAAEAFVGPGVTIGDGCVLGARACAFADLEAWTVYRGNPAGPVKPRAWRSPPPRRS
jgi:putative colanic acid biosynthesis acetyltransferase WcaF